LVNYPKMSIKDDPHPRGGTWLFNPQLSHLAVVAAGRSSTLRAVAQRSAFGRQYHASHLCGNARCWNPDHVYVESEAVNEARKTCQGRKSTVCGCGSVWNPCPHVFMEGSCGKACIIAVWKCPAELEGHKVYYQATSNEASFRTSDRGLIGS
jgi:hypothetical protein